MTNQQQQEKDRRDQQKRDEIWQNQNQVQGQTRQDNEAKHQADRPPKRGDPEDERGRAYKDIEQPGLHPGNLPGRRLERGPDESGAYLDRSKPNHDLEDITGNPGHLNINPNAPAEPVNEMRGAPVPKTTAEAEGGSVASINEPPGSSVVPVDPNAPPVNPGAGEVTLTSLDPDTVAVDGGPTFTLHVTGENFDDQCKIVFDDEELATTFINSNQMYADVPIQEFPGEVDVEVHRGEEMSDVMTFEFIAAQGGTRSREKPARKPKKSVPAHKRLKKHKR